MRELGEEPACAAPPLTRRELGWAAVGLALTVTLFLSPALLRGRFLSPSDLLFGFYPWAAQPPAGWSAPSNGSLFDGPLQVEPWLAYAAQQLHAGALPLWNPNNMLGAPFFGNMQSSVLYPGNWPAFLWPGGAMLVVGAWLKLFIAGLGMYLLTRRVFHMRPLGASIAVLTFTFGAFLTDWLIWPIASTAAWLPWLWLTTARLFDQPGPRRVAALAGVVALALLAGHPENNYQLAVVTGLFAVGYAWQSGPAGLAARARLLGLWCLAYLLGALLTSIQLLPFVEYLMRSAVVAERNNGGTNAGIPFSYAWTWISPDLFGNPAHRNWWVTETNYDEANGYSGVLPLLLAPFSLLMPNRRQRGLAVIVLVIAGVALLLIYHAPGSDQLQAVLPFLRLSVANRFLFAGEFALGLLAGLGVDNLERRLAQDWRRPDGWLTAVTLLLLVGGIGVPWLFADSYFHLPVDSAMAIQVWQGSLWRALGLLLAGAALLAALIGTGRARPRVARRLACLLPLLLLGDLWQAHGDYTPTIAPRDYFPPTAATHFLQAQPAPFRVMAADHTLLQNTNLMYGLADLRGYDSLEPESYADLADVFDPTSSDTSSGMWHAFARSPSPLWNLLNVRYVLAAPGDDPNYTTDLRQEASGSQTVGEIRKSNRPGQTFVAGQDNLAGIQVLGATFGGQARGQLIFHLKADPAAPDLATEILDVGQLGDNSFWTITFPPITGAKGRTFYFYFEAPDASKGHAATLWYSQDDAYPEGSRTSNGKPVDDDLTFRTLVRIDSGPLWFTRVLDGGARAASIFENRRALPRAWLVHRVEVLPDQTVQPVRLADPGFDPTGTGLLNAALPPEQILPAVPPPTNTEAVSITLYAGERVEIATDSPAPGLLMLADQAFPGWTAEVDGQPATILTVDHALRGVYLPVGTHTVRFAYAPLSVQAGAVLSVCGLLVLALLAAWPRRRPRYKDQDAPRGPGLLGHAPTLQATTRELPFD